MSVRFEILVNGVRAPVSGIYGDGLLSANVSYFKRKDDDAEVALSVSGLGQIHSWLKELPVEWIMPPIAIGDEITIRILPGGEFDPPEGISFKHHVALEDPDFGKIEYNLNAWDVDIPLACPPLAKAHLHLFSDETGLSAVHRKAIREFLDRQTQVWPEICAALIRCHPDLKTIEELNGRIDPTIAISMYDESNMMELAFSFAGDELGRDYIVILRDGEVVEVFHTE